MNGLPLNEQVIVVIGGTAGLGLSASLAICRAGGYVVAVGLDDEALPRAAQLLGARGRTLAADARSSDTAQRAIELASTSFGRVDGLYHVAGGSGRRFGDGPLHQVTDEGVAATLSLNLQPVIYSNRAALQYFESEQRGGSILNMASVLADRPAPQFFSTHVYAAAKAAIIGLTQSIAAYYAPHGIRCNVIAPGLVATPMSQRAQQDPRIMEYIATKQPLDGGRIGQPEDLDAAAVFLLSNEARFITGQVLRVDGGWSVTDGRPPAPSG